MQERDDLGLATGTIALMDGVTILDTCSLQGLDPNACSLTTSAIVAGTRSITARYLGDAAYAPATSAAVAQTVLRAGSTTVLFGNANASTYGDAVTFPVVVTTVDGSIATGSVSLSDGSTTVAGTLAICAAVDRRISVFSLTFVSVACDRPASFRSFR